MIAPSPGHIHLSFRRSRYNLAKSSLDLCMEESTSHGIGINLLKRFSCMKCLFFALFISFKYDSRVNAERMKVTS